MNRAPLAAKNGDRKAESGDGVNRPLPRGPVYAFQAYAFAFQATADKPWSVVYRPASVGRDGLS